MAPSLAPDLDDQIAEAVHDLGILVEVGRALNVADRPQPLRHAIEVTQLALERREDREPREPSGVVPLLRRQVAADNPWTSTAEPSMAGWPAT
jgi:hypothetical protein